MAEEQGDISGSEEIAVIQNHTSCEVHRNATIVAAVKTILHELGEDPERPALLKTPERFARAMRDFTCGYDMSVEAATSDAIFEVDSNDLVFVRDIDVHSLCEHHLLPFLGKIHVGYIPNGQVLGLSKLVRIVEIFARRLQIQERLTQEIGEAIQQVLQPKGVAVVAECSHMCMTMRGVARPSALTVTESKTGIFQHDAHVNEGFHAMLGFTRR